MCKIKQQNENKSVSLSFSWGSWDEILATAGIRKGFTAKDVEDAVRLSLLYCVNTYQGDDKIRSFIWDLITPAEHGGGQDKVAKNHSGLSGPIPRGKRGLGRTEKKKPAKEEGVVPEMNIPGIRSITHHFMDMLFFFFAEDSKRY